MPKRLRNIKISKVNNVTRELLLPEKGARVKPVYSKENIKQLGWLGLCMVIKVV
jgi:hypothetical protein